MKYEKRYLYYSILPCCLLLIVIGIYAFGYNPPTQNPPYGNLPAPINAGPNPQTKEGDLTVKGNFTTEGILKLGQFITANLPAEAEGALVFNTTKNVVQIYSSGAWRDLTATKLGSGETCSLDGDCDSAHCVDGVCCSTSCEGTCNRCNVAGSIGTCIEAPSDCTGCSICSSGNCIVDPTKCTGNCVQCTGSGTNYSCSANLSVCTGDCSFCSGSGTEYNCVGSHGFCSSTAGSCYCSGSGTSFNCQSCTTAGICQTGGGCSNYSCVAVGNAAIDSQPSGCTGCSFCNGAGACLTCYWETIYSYTGYGNNPVRSGNCKPSFGTAITYSPNSTNPTACTAYRYTGKEAHVGITCYGGRCICQ